MTGNHVLKVIANASPPLNVGPGFRQYDFFIDGMSFFSLPKVFRLGLRGGGVGGPPMGGMSMAGGGSGPRRQMSINNIAAIEAPHNVDEEQAYLQAAIKKSLADAPAVPAGKDYGDLLDFSDPEPVSAMVPSQMANGANQYAVPGAGGPIPYSPAPFAPAPQPMATDMNTGFASPPPAFAPMPGPVPAPSPYGQPVPQPAQPAPAADPFGMPPPAPGSPPPAADQSAPGQLSMFSAPAPTKAANADQAYQNMANLNDFNLVSKTEQAANNPFAPSPCPGSNSRGDEGNWRRYRSAKDQRYERASSRSHGGDAGPERQPVGHGRRRIRGGRPPPPPWACTAPHPPSSSSSSHTE